jgi:biotin transport system substrate-specific component
MSAPREAIRRHGRSRLAAPYGAGKVLADNLPGDRARDYLLAAGYVLAVALVGRFSAAPDGALVPVTFQAPVVLLGAVVLGWRRALAGMVAYALLCLAGVPWFADDGAGGPLGAMRSLRFGYVLGFVVASMVVGGVAARGFDRSPVRTAAMLLGGLLIIYGFGLPWLMASLSIGPGRAVAGGIAPFLPVDLAGVAAGMVLLPTAWAVLRRRGS